MGKMQNILQVITAWNMLLVKNHPWQRSMSLMAISFYWVLDIQIILPSILQNIGLIILQKAKKLQVSH